MSSYGAKLSTQRKSGGLAEASPTASSHRLVVDGKILYKTADKVKLQDYTLRKILQQVHREQGDSDSEAKGPKAA